MSCCVSCSSIFLASATLFFTLPYPSVVQPCRPPTRNFATLCCPRSPIMSLFLVFVICFSLDGRQRNSSTNSYRCWRRVPRTSSTWENCGLKFRRGLVLRYEGFKIVLFFSPFFCWFIPPRPAGLLRGCRVENELFDLLFW